MKTKNPKFDAEGYQIGMHEINGEPLPDLSKAKIVRRAKAGLPPVSEVKKALAGLNAGDPHSYMVVREKAGLTQGQFASALGVKLSTYRQWEHGRRVPTGPAKALLRLVSIRPTLIRVLQKAD